MRRVTDRSERIRTPYIWANFRQCTACWRCVGACPEQVIGKVRFLWHKHVVIRHPEACSGCQKCIRTCPHHVFAKR